MQLRLYNDNKVLDSIINHYCDMKPEKHMISSFYTLVRKYDLNDAFPKLYKHASVPLIRAIALEALALNKVKLVTGYKEAPKYYIVSKIPTIEYKSIYHNLNVTDILAQEANDKSIVVRRRVARCLIELIDIYNGDFAPIDEIAFTLSKDSSETLRDTVKFYLSKRGVNH